MSSAPESPSLKETVKKFINSNFSPKTVELLKETKYKITGTKNNKTTTVVKDEYLKNTQTLNNLIKSSDRNIESITNALKAVQPPEDIAKFFEKNKDMLGKAITQSPHVLLALNGAIEDKTKKDEVFKGIFGGINKILNSENNTEVVEEFNKIFPEMKIEEKDITPEFKKKINSLQEIFKGMTAGNDEALKAGAEAIKGKLEKELEGFKNKEMPKFEDIMDIDKTKLKENLENSPKESTQEDKEANKIIKEEEKKNKIDTSIVLAVAVMAIVAFPAVAPILLPVITSVVVVVTGTIVAIPASLGMLGGIGATGATAAVVAGGVVAHNKLQQWREDKKDQKNIEEKNVEGMREALNNRFQEGGKKFEKLQKLTSEVEKKEKLNDEQKANVKKLIIKQEVEKDFGKLNTTKRFFGKDKVRNDLVEKNKNSIVEGKTEDIMNKLGITGVKDNAKMPVSASNAPKNLSRQSTANSQKTSNTLSPSHLLFDR